MNPKKVATSPSKYGRRPTGKSLKFVKFVLRKDENVAMNSYLDIAKRALQRHKGLVEEGNAGFTNNEFNEINEFTGTTGSELPPWLTMAEFDQAFADGTARDEELAEIERRVFEQGVCLTWCAMFEDYVAFLRDDVDPATIPPGFICYSDSELRHLFGDDKPDISPGALKLIHAAKKTGAVVIDLRPERPEN
ncbi:MAG: hypothetical protein FI707_17255 [SAR202 cluster bacterium]|nr:hypothetical protein [SAR202 cluster bacterium]